MSNIDPVVIRTMLREMHQAAYGFAADINYLHQVEDQVAAYLGVRVIRADQPDLLTPAQLHTLCYRTLADLEKRAA